MLGAQAGHPAAHGRQLRECPGQDRRSVAASLQLRVDGQPVQVPKVVVQRDDKVPRHSPIFAFCEKPGVANTLTLNYGVTPFVIPFDHQDPEKTIDTAMATLRVRKLLREGGTAVVITSVAASETMVDAVQMRQV